jgi:glycolate oxidase FAD binding subunit
VVGARPQVDGLEPDQVVQPRNEDEVARRLREAAEAGQAVIPIGGRRLLGMGNRPRRFDLALDLSGLDRILERSPHDLTVSVQAGITLEALNQELGKEGQFLPLDPPGGPGHTIGGLIATGLSGPLRLRYGSARDFLIGLRVALPDGRLATSGGRVVKNVSGYDLNKLHLGAMGSLGVIVAASFKVFPRALHEATLEAQTDDPWAAARRALELRMPPVAVEVASGGRALARLMGGEAAVRRVAAELGWEEVPAGRWEELMRRRSDSWARISTPPGALRKVLDSLPPGSEWWASPGVGSAHWFGWREPADVRRARAAAEAAGGSLVLISAPAELKVELDAWGRPPDTLDVMRRLRDAFDPKRTLSPGRYLV